VTAYTFTNVTANHSIDATFAINTYTLTYTAGANGTMSGTSPQTVDYNTSGTSVAAVANTGYHFVSWSDGVLTASRTDVNVTANISVTASFAINAYTLTYTAGANGTISGTTPQTVNHGANGAAVTAAPNLHYHFVSWSDGVLTASRTDLNVTANISATASFVIDTYIVTPSAGANGSLSPATAQTVNYNATTPFTVTPGTGYHIDTVTGCGGSLVGNTYTTGPITAGCTVTAGFAPNDALAPIVSNTQALPVALNTSGTLTATISDATTGGSKIVSWYYTIDGVARPVIYIASGSQAITVNVTGSIPASSTTDVREICVFGIDAATNTSIKMDCALQAIYDPSAGFVTGGGWIMSPAGAYSLDPTSSGKGTFGFVSKYTNGKAVPTGNTEFQYHEGSFNFSSTVYEWLVVSGPMAQYKGSGTINGSGDYGFLLSAVDGQLTGGGGTDKFRIKVWNKSTGNVIYDNNMGSADTSTPTTVLGGGSIVMHK
jgi:hypothetical protein